MIIEETLQLLQHQLNDTLGDLVQIITLDAQLARPANGKVAIFIEPPELEWPRNEPAPDIIAKIDIIAGTTATQATSVTLIYQALEAIADAGICLTAARPVTFGAANSANLAAYQADITL